MQFIGYLGSNSELYVLSLSHILSIHIPSNHPSPETRCDFICSAEAGGSLLSSRPARVQHCETLLQIHKKSGSSQKTSNSSKPDLPRVPSRGQSEDSSWEARQGTSIHKRTLEPGQIWLFLPASPTQPSPPTPLISSLTKRPILLEIN